MTDLQTILEGIDELPLDALQQIEQHIADRRQALEQIDTDEIENQIAAFDHAFENFWLGFSDTEVEAIIEDMNREYIEPTDTLFDNLQGST